MNFRNVYNKYLLYRCLKKLKKGKFVTLYFEEHYLMIVETTKRKSRCFYLGLPDHLMSVIFNNFREGSFLIVDNSVSRITYNFILTNRKNWGKVIIRAID